MSINNNQKELLNVVKIPMSETEKDELVNNSNSDVSDVQSSINLNDDLNKKIKRKKNFSKKYYQDESSNSENFIEPKKGINYELIKKYEKKVEELKNEIYEVKKELKTVKRDKLEIEQELQESKEEKEKL